MTDADHGVILKAFAHPDELREMPLGRFELATLVGQTIGRATYAPGWKWSEHVSRALGLGSRRRAVRLARPGRRAALRERRPRLTDEPMKLEQLDYLYLPSADVAADMASLVDAFGARVAFAIEGMGTRVAMLELGHDSPRLLLAGHLHGERPVLVYRVADLEASLTDAAADGWVLEARLELPPGPCATFRSSGGQRIAVYEATRPGVVDGFMGRRDF